MAECSFSFNLEVDQKQIIQTVKSKIEQEGGTFTEDASNGNFLLPTPVGEVEGSFKITGNQLNIDIIKKPAFLPCSLIESELKKRLSNGRT